MAKNFILGTRSCIILTKLGSEWTQYSISNNVDFIYEYDDETGSNQWSRVRTLGGKLKRKFNYLVKKWEVSFNQIFLPIDSKKIEEVLDKEKAGHQVFLIPHSELLDRMYEVASVPEKRQIAYHYGGDNCEGNKGFVITFETVEPIYNHNWTQPDDANYQPTGQGIDNLI